MVAVMQRGNGSGGRPNPTEAANASTGQQFLVVFGAILLVLAVVGVGVTIALFFIHTDGSTAIDGDHLTNSEYDSAVNRRVVAADHLLPAAPTGTAVTVEDPVSFYGDVVVDGDIIVAQVTNDTVTGHTVITNLLVVPDPNNAVVVRNLLQLVTRVVADCGPSELQTMVELIITQITELIDTQYVQLIDYSEDYERYLLSFEARNETFFTNQATIDAFNVTCGNAGDVNAYIVAYNATADRIQLQISLYNTNVITYTATLDRYNNISATITGLLSGNCSALVNLQTEVTMVTMYYNGTLVSYNVLNDSCADCAASLAAETTRFNNLVVTENTLISNSATLLTESNVLYNDSVILRDQINTTLSESQVITTALVQQRNDYLVLNGTLTAMKVNATLLRDLAAQLSTDQVTLLNNLITLDTTITDTQILIEPLISNCSAVNATNVQAAIDLVNQYIANMTALYNEFLVTQTDLNTLLTVDIAALETRMTVVETNLTQALNAYNDAYARFLVLNATYTSLLAQYQVQLTRYNTLLAELASQQLRVTAANNAITTLVGDLALVTTQQTFNGGNLTNQEAQIAALEPDLGCSALASGGGSPTAGLRILTLPARQNMTRGTPVVVASDGRVAAARGLLYTETSDIYSIEINATSGVNQPVIGKNVAIDQADFLYHGYTVRADAVIRWGPLNTSFTGSLSNTCYGNGGSRNGYVLKTSPSKDVLWAAQISGSVNFAQMLGVEYDTATDSLWVSVKFRKLDSGCVAPNAIQTVEFFDPGATVPSLSYSFNASVSADVRFGWIIAQIARNGHWRHMEVIRLSDNNEPMNFGTPASSVERREPQFIRMNANKNGRLAMLMTLRDYTVSGNGVWQFGDNYNSSVSALMTTNKQLHIAYYDTVARTFLWDRNWVNEYGPQDLAITKGDIWVDDDNSVYYVAGTGKSTTLSDVTFTLVDGSTVLAHGVHYNITVSRKMYVVATRMRALDGVYYWVQQVTSNDANGTPDIVNADDALEALATYKIATMGRVVVVAMPVSNNVQFAGAGQRTFVFAGLTVTGEDGTDPWPLNQFVLFEGDKTSGEFSIALRPETGQFIAGAPFYVDRRDRLYVMTYREINRSKQENRVVLPIQIGTETFYATGDVDPLATVTGRYMIVRFDGTLANVGFFQELVQDGSGLLDGFDNRIVVDSHDNVHLFRKATSYFAGYSTGKISSGWDLSLRYEDVAAPADQTYVYVVSFSQADQAPLGLLVNDAIDGGSATFVMRGEATLAGFFTAPDDYGGHYKIRTMGGTTIVRTGGPPETAVIGFKTATTATQFLVDIHTMPAVGSNQ